MKAVVLFNLGGPTSRDAVEPFLFNLFSDPDVIRLPWGLRWLQNPLARMISRRRGPESRGNYDLIGGHSPLLPNTERQAEALAARLGPDYRVLIAMRYWNPRAEEVVQQLRELNPEAIVLLPLYPQYSISTTASSTNDFMGALESAQWSPDVRKVEHWHDRPGYAELIAATVRDALSGCDMDNTHLLFSAHGVPVSYVEKYGDPYQRHIHESVAAVLKLLPNNLSSSLSYQSRVGPVKWLGPDIEEELTRLSTGARKTILVYPLSFVSEHVETIFELDILYGDKAKALGLDYRRLPAFGDRPDFIELLATLALEAAEENP